MNFLQNDNTIRPSQEDVDHANYLLKNPIDLNMVDFSSVFPVCNIEPKRTALGLSRIEHFRRSHTKLVHLTFNEIIQVMTKFVAEVKSLNLSISAACTSMTLYNDNFSYSLGFYVDDSDFHEIEVEKHVSFYLHLRRNNGISIWFYKIECLFYDLLLDADLSRQYIEGSYILPFPSVEEPPINENKKFSFDDLQSDL
jgi:hypothetical protein